MPKRRLQTALTGRSVRIVCYHHFTATPCVATRSLGTVTTPDALRHQLDVFAQRYVPIGLDELLSGDVPDRALLVTIDDSYRSTLDVAAPELSARRIPAVMFINPEPIERPFLPLDNVVAIARDTLPPAELTEILHGGAVRHVDGDPSLHAVPVLPLPAATVLKERLLRRLGASEEALYRRLDLFLRPQDIPALADHGIEIGNHTMSHVKCRTLEGADFESEIRAAKDWIEARSGRPVRSFSIPWGQIEDATPATMAAIRASGHAATFLVHGRRNVVRPAPDVWYRTAMTSEVGWRLRVLLELWPVLSSLRHGTTPIGCVAGWTQIAAAALAA